MTGQEPLFPPLASPIPDRACYLGATHTFARAALLAAARHIGLDALDEPLLLDLALMRIIEPASKLRSVELIERYFGVHYRSSGIYERLPRFAMRKAEIEQAAVAYAKEVRSSDLSLVLYDVTTLYFESFEADELRVPGFSKDNKAQQPQIVVGLLVTREGFPLGYEVFKGNTFEGHTMLPVLESFARAHRVETPTVVADAAMLSRENTATLAARGYAYIVGARLANASPSVIKKVSCALARKDGKTVRIATKHGDLVAAFSLKRYRKDKREMDGQIRKAKELVAGRKSGKRAKFVLKSKNEALTLDEPLIAKATLLLGVKGYYTNISREKLSDTEVIARYHDLWNVEASFRMAKSDLATRPIFHHKKDAIRAHVVVCFVALLMGKTLELSSGLSLRRVRDLLWSITDAAITDTVTGETFVLRSPMEHVIHSPIGKLLKKWGLSH